MGKIGVQVSFFCDVVNVLTRRFGDRGADPNVMNEIAQLAGKLEEAYHKLPKLPPRKADEPSTDEGR